LSTSFSLNPSAEVARSLASIYAKQGNAQKTIEYLAQTVALEPTKAQNFYDLARIQTQAGQVSQALTTYSQLVSLISDPTQKIQVEAEKKSLENLLAQNGSTPTTNTTLPTPSISANPSIKLESPLLQADSGQGLIIAAPETSKNIAVDNLTDSNAQAGTATLPANQKDITISNTNVTSTSQVYLSITQGGKNQTLKLISKSNGSFTAGFDSPLSEDVTFKWWIIN
jgi:tetratricopeptide (TPR) repeat protein